MRLKVERKTHYGRILWSKNLVNCAWQVSISKVSGLLTPPTQYRGRCHHCFYGLVARPILIYSQETGPRLVYQLTRLQDTAAVNIHEVAGLPRPHWPRRPASSRELTSSLFLLCPRVVRTGRHRNQQPSGL